MATCFRCGAGTDKTCYIQLGRVSVGVAGTAVRSRYLEAECCDACYRLGRRVFYLKLLALLLMVLIPCLVLGGCVTYTRAVGPERAQAVGGRLFFGGLAICLAVWIGLPLWIRFASRPMIANFLGDDLDRRCRALCGVRQWTYGKSVWVRRRPPPVRAAPLSAIRTD